jgi:hypothetical protein
MMIEPHALKVGKVYWYTFTSGACSEFGSTSDPPEFPEDGTAFLVIEAGCYMSDDAERSWRTQALTVLTCDGQVQHVRISEYAALYGGYEEVPMVVGRSLV